MPHSQFIQVTFCKFPSTLSCHAKLDDKLESSLNWVMDRTGRSIKAYSRNPVREVSGTDTARDLGAEDGQMTLYIDFVYT
jgi:hypothetical protein